VSLNITKLAQRPKRIEIRGSWHNRDQKWKIPVPIGHDFWVAGHYQLGEILGILDQSVPFGTIGW